MVSNYNSSLPHPPSSAGSAAAVGMQPAVPRSGRRPLTGRSRTPGLRGPLRLSPRQHSTAGSRAPGCSLWRGRVRDGPAALGLCGVARGCQLRPPGTPTVGCGVWGEREKAPAERGEMSTRRLCQGNTFISCSLNQEGLEPR